MSVRLDMLGIVTKDLGASLQFYRTLGLDVPEFDLNKPYVEITLPNGLRLSWNKVEMIKEIDPHWVDPVGMRLGMAFLCDDPAGVDATHARMIAAGFRSKMDPFDAFWGQRYAVVEDPDGNGVDLFAPLAPAG
jgi:catechol 2,3-dioxygenase-like lactoylglutathione lyase family enzyme